MFRKENFYKYFTLICALAFLGACGKKEEKKQVEEAPKVCTNTCKTWEVRTDFPECKCQLPEYKLPDAKLQAELINAALRGDLAFIKKQIPLQEHKKNYRRFDYGLFGCLKQKQRHTRFTAFA